jgi:hypothetical protein
LTRNKVLIILLIVVTIFFPHSNTAAASTITDDKSNLSVLVDISEEELYLIDTKNNKIIKTYKIADGKASTPSPIGTWEVVSLSRSNGCFGSRWIGLNVPWGSYAIHGTNIPGSIGSKASHGCIRMLNKHVEELYEYMELGTIVAIYAGPCGPFENGLKIIKPGAIGSEVFEIQKRMKNLGYYPRAITGMYGEGMKKYVLKFREDTMLKHTANIDREFYKKLGIELID